LGDYLTLPDANRARPLYGFNDGEQAVGYELAVS